MNDSMLVTSRGEVEADSLRSLVQDIEGLEQEKVALCEDIRHLYRRARSAGVDMRLLRQALRLHKSDLPESRKRVGLLELYEEAFSIECHASWF